jgi:hypothetical protein
MAAIKAFLRDNFIAFGLMAISVRWRCACFSGLRIGGAVTPSK